MTRVSRWLLGAALLELWAFELPGVGSPPCRAAELSYRVSIHDPALQRVDVRLTLTGLEPDRETLQLALSERPGFVRLPVPLLEAGVTATAGDDSLRVLRSGPYAWTVELHGATAARLTWQVPLGHRDLRAVVESGAFAAQPYLDIDHGLLTTGTLFLVPLDAEFGSPEVVFSLPPGWRALPPWPRSSEGSSENPPASPREDLPASPPEERFRIERRESLVREAIPVGRWEKIELPTREGGRLTVLTTEGGAGRHRPADMHNAARRSRSELLATVVRILQRDDWPGERTARLVFTRPDGPGASGQALTQSLVLSIPPRLWQGSAPDASHLTVHELLHALTGPLELEPSLRWFEEGVTDHLAHRLLAEERAISWEQFAATLESICLEAEVNLSQGKRPLALCGSAFFDDEECARFVYEQGALLGAWLDLALGQHVGACLLQVRHDLAHARERTEERTGERTEDPAREEDTPISSDRLFELLARSLPADRAMALRAWVENPERWRPEVELGALGVEIERVQRRGRLEPDRLPDLEAELDGPLILDLRRDDVAHLVGLRPLDRLLEINGNGVSDERDVRYAWRRPRAGRIHVTADRVGRVIVVDRPIPPQVRYEIDPEPWRDLPRCRATPAEAP